jgi:antitoxin HigA-1
MTTVKNKNAINLKVEIGSNKPKQWTESEIARLKTFAKDNAKRRSDEQKINNKLMALRYEIEEYLNHNRSKPLTLEDVVWNYLNVLNLPFRKFAVYLDTTDSNLKKYVTGERKFNKDLALKFSHFFHTPAELWLKLQLKNELFELKNKKEIKQYEKYDYRKVIGILD